MNATTQQVIANVNAEKFMDWAISSQAAKRLVEGSTTNAYGLSESMKRHECGGCLTGFLVGDILKVRYIIEDISVVARKFFATREELQAVYLRLESYELVAEHFGVSRRTVANFMHKYGIPKFAQLSDRHDEFLALVAEGKSVPEIAKELGYCVRHIRNYAEKHAIHIPDTYHVGYSLTSHGYRRVRRPEHPAADSAGYVLEHRLLMEVHLGRYLDEDEVVHHIDGDIINNDISNLQVMSRSDHVSLHRQLELDKH